MKPRNVVKFTASSTETSGAPPAAGRKPANASSTEQTGRRNTEKKKKKQRGGAKDCELNRTLMFYTFLYLKPEIFPFCTLSTFARSVCFCFLF